MLAGALKGAINGAATRFPRFFFTNDGLVGASS